MKVFLDGSPLATADGSIAAALDAARASTEPHGRIIVDVRADGRPLDPALLDAPPADDHGFERLTFSSAVAAAFVASALDEADGCLDDLEGRHAESAELIQAGRLAEGVEAVRGVVETWQLVRQAVDSGSAILGLDPSTVAGADGVALEVRFRRLVGTLGELRDCLVAEDWSGAADLIGYDLAERLVEWRGVLASVRTAIGADADSRAQGDAAP